MTNLFHLGGSVPPVGGPDATSSVTTRQTGYGPVVGGGKRPTAVADAAKSVAEAAKDAAREKGKASKEALQNMAEEANQSLSHVTSLRFQVEEELDKVVVRVVDKDTQELIRQIPDEDLLDLVRRMRDLQGVMFDKQA